LKRAGERRGGRGGKKK